MNRQLNDHPAKTACTHMYPHVYVRVHACVYGLTHVYTRIVRRVFMQSPAHPHMRLVIPGASLGLQYAAGQGSSTSLSSPSWRAQASQRAQEGMGEGAWEDSPH